MNRLDAFGARIIIVGILVMAWVVFFIWLGRRLNVIDWWAIGLIGSALFTFFGFLLGTIDENGTIREAQIRLAITATLIVAYIVFFGSAVYLNPGNDETYAKSLLPTLTNLLMVSISFYFGSTAAIEIAKSLSRKGKPADAREE